MQRWIELHDSVLLGQETDGDWLVLSLDAYVHQWERIDGLWSGTGWMQPVDLRLKAAAPATGISFPIGVSDGSLAVGSTRLDNGAPLPFEATSATELDLVLVSGGRVSLRGDAAALLEVGVARYVERLPDEFRPVDGVEGVEVDSR